jgi:hypothetical protein
MLVFCKQSKGEIVKKVTRRVLLATAAVALQLVVASSGTLIALPANAWDTQSSASVPGTIKWDRAVVKQAVKVVEKQASDAQKLLTDLKSQGVVFVKITSVKPSSLELQPFKGYKFMTPYLATPVLNGYGDWSQKKSKERFSPSVRGTILPRMATFKSGNCRLTFSLFNSDTWFTPDCKVKSAKPEEYLRASLISFIDNSPLANPSAFFFEYISILSVVGDKADYEIRDGRIYSDALDPAYSESGMELKYIAEDGVTGYEVLVGAKKWDLQFVAAKPDPVILAATARFVTADGQTWVTFGPK